MIFIKAYDMEFKKYSSRTASLTGSLASLRLNKVMCEDLISSIASPLTQIGTLEFSTVYFLDFNKLGEKTDFSRLYVLDGVKYLHEKSGSSFPLIRNRDLFYFLYSDNVNNAIFSKALLTNPWLNELCPIPTQFMSERVRKIKEEITRFNASKLRKTIFDDVSSDYTPRGVWGLDYMFLWKRYDTPPETQLGFGMELVNIDEYVQSFVR